MTSEVATPYSRSPDFGSYPTGDPDGAQPALCTRDELRAHFTSAGDGPRLVRRVENLVIHETTDPEVIVAEFEYRGTNADTGAEFTQPGIFVLRVRDGEFVSSRDYFDHLTGAAIRGTLDDVVAAFTARGA